MIVKVKYKMLTSKEGKTYHYMGVKRIAQMGNTFALITETEDTLEDICIAIDPKECESIQIEEDK